MATKLRREIEPRWVAEYVLANYPEDPVKYRVPLGAIPTDVEERLGPEKARRSFRPWRPEVDALVLQKARLILVEGKIFKYMDGLSKLPIYKSLIPSTPELQAYKALPVDMELLLVRPVSWVTEAAEKAGVRIVLWAPPWIIPIWEERDKYWAPDAVAAREQRKEVLKKLGYT